MIDSQCGLDVSMQNLSKVNPDHWNAANNQTTGVIFEKRFTSKQFAVNITRLRILFRDSVSTPG